MAPFCEVLPVLSKKCELIWPLQPKGILIFFQYFLESDSIFGYCSISILDIAQLPERVLRYQYTTLTSTTVGGHGEAKDNPSCCPEPDGQCVAGQGNTRHPPPGRGEKIYRQVDGTPLETITTQKPGWKENLIYW